MLGDPFNPETGVFAENIRTPDPDGYNELRESMRKFGYLPGHPVIVDENGVIIAGHRRAKVADELGLTPEVRALTFGSGDAADSYRLMMGIGSNLGFEKISPADRAKIAAHLYQGKQWSMAKIAEVLHVTIKTVSRDLSSLTDVKPPPSRGGRPRKQPEPAAPKPEPEQVNLTIVKDEADDEPAESKPCSRCHGTGIEPGA